MTCRSIYQFPDRWDQGRPREYALFTYTRGFRGILQDDMRHRALVVRFERTAEPGRLFSSFQERAKR
jgi:hypothetical protein